VEETLEDEGCVGVCRELDLMAGERRQGGANEEDALYAGVGGCSGRTSETARTIILAQIIVRRPVLADAEVL
jgi:hypothetical protein